MFTYLTAGFAIGLALYCLPLEAMAYSNNDFSSVYFQNAVAFLLMACFEQLSTAWKSSVLASYSYKPLALEEELEIEMTVRDDDPAVDHTDLKIPSHGKRIEPNSAQPHRNFPSLFLFVASLYSLVDSFEIGMQDLSHQEILIQLIIEKMLISYTCGHFLEFLSAPTSYALYFIAIFSLSAPLGIILGSLVEVDSSLLRVMHGTSAALCSGATLFLASNHILPTESMHIQKETGIHPMIKTFLMVAGFVIATIPSIILD